MDLEQFEIGLLKVIVFVSVCVETTIYAIEYMSTSMYAIEYKKFGGSSVGSIEAYSIERKLAVCFQVLGVSQLDRTILYTLANGGGWSMRSLSAFLGVPRATLRRKIERLSRAGYVDNPGSGLQIGPVGFGPISDEIQALIALVIGGAGPISPLEFPHLLNISKSLPKDLRPFEVPE